MSSATLPPAIRQLVREPRAGVAAFDADGVLWHGDVSEDFAEWMIAAGHFDGARWQDYVELAARDFRAACFGILEFYVGMPRDELDAHVSRFWEEGPPRRWIGVVRDTVAAVRTAGMRVLVVSGTPLPVLRPLPDVLEIDGIVALELEFDPGGRATGRATGVPSVAEGKAERIRAESTGSVLLAAGNSILDAPMLALSEGVAWAVNPDAELRAVAAAEGWLITDEPLG